MHGPVHIRPLGFFVGITHVSPPNSRFCTTVPAGRLDARIHGPARPRVQLRTQHVPTESIQRRSTRSPAVLPMQIDELQ
eukprot:3401459-Alexandrium_andersonii.AAC.1